MDSYLDGHSGLNKLTHEDGFYDEHMGGESLNQTPVYDNNGKDEAEGMQTWRMDEHKSPSEQSENFFSVLNYNPSPEESYGGNGPGSLFNNGKSNSHVTPNGSVTMSMPGAFLYGDEMDTDDGPTFNPDNYFDLEKTANQVGNGQEVGVATPFTANTSHIDMPEPFPKMNLALNEMGDEDELSSRRFRGESIDSYSHRMPSSSFSHMNHHPNNSNTNNMYGDMSPLTTTTSLTPSVSSIHSTQMSFFSAHQYLTRNSFDQPPSQPHFRRSIELYGNNLHNSEGQGKHSNSHFNTGGRYANFTTSISNYIPSMSDRNQRSPSHNSSIISQQSPDETNNSMPPHNNNSRHLIRSIFKSSNIQNQNTLDENGDFMYENEDLPHVVNEDDELAEYNSQRDDRELDLMDPSSNRKNKKSKINIFHRFKTPTKPGTVDANFLAKHSDTEEGSEAGNLDVYNFNGERVNSNTSFPSAQHSTVDSTSDGDPAVQNIGEVMGDKQPDYAALFEKVGKRRNLVNNSHRKTKAKAKENQNESTITSPVISFHADNGDKKLSSYSSSNTDEPKTSISSESVISELWQPSTQSPEKNNKPTGTNQSSSTFASASKRILGSKLTSKKKSGADLEALKANAMPTSKQEEVEVDIQTLGLPPTTKVFPSSIVNQKARTRGRKENKEADLSDSTKIYLCNYCSRRFKRQEHLKRHFRSLHTFEKPYDCNICNKKFSRSDNLNQHLKIHKNEENGVQNE